MAALTAAGAGKVFREVASGAKTGRAQLRPVFEQPAARRSALRIAPSRITEESGAMPSGIAPYGLLQRLGIPGYACLTI